MHGSTALIRGQRRISWSILGSGPTSAACVCLDEGCVLISWHCRASLNRQALGYDSFPIVCTPSLPLLYFLRLGHKKMYQKKKVLETIDFCCAKAPDIAAQ